MPIFWRYLLKEYLRTLALCTFSFIAILLVGRIEKVAQLGAMGASFKLIATFIVLQIPYILPIAIPISGLIAAIILTRRLSLSFELTAFRAHGFSLKQVVAPLLFMSTFLAFLNFYIASELATTAHLTSKQMIYKHTSLNPLLLIQNAKIAQLKSGYVEMLPEHQGQSAKNLLIALPGKESHLMNLLIAKRVKVKEENLVAEKVTFITGVPKQTGEKESFDHLIIENQGQTMGKAPEFAQLLRKSQWKVSNDHLKLSLLLGKISHLNTSFFDKNVQKCYSEIMRRITLALAPFSFTLLGLAFGIVSTRAESKKGIITVILLASLALICFFAGKECGYSLFLSVPLFFLPHLLIGLLSLRALKSIEEGKLK